VGTKNENKFQLIGQRETYSPGFWGGGDSIFKKGRPGENMQTPGTRTSCVASRKGEKYLKGGKILSFYERRGG